MSSASRVCVGVVAGMLACVPAHAQKEAMGMIYEMQMAPKLCGWANTPDPRKLDAAIASQEKALGITAAEKAALVKSAEAELKADPSNCAPDGMLRAMYDESVK